MASCRHRHFGDDALTPDQPVFLDIAGLAALIDGLKEDGYSVAGPQAHEGAIIYDIVEGVDDLPRGWVDEQEGGHYRLRREGDAYFSHVVGPQSWKKFLHPPRQRLWHTRTENGETTLHREPVTDENHAFIGMRGCELAAIAVQDKVFMEGPYADPHYRARREGAFFVAVNCGRAADTCFCVSMETGPKANAGYDIALTEIATGDDAGFLAEAGSARGRAMLDRLPGRPATEAECASAVAVTDATARSMRRSIDTDGLPDLIKNNPEHPRWIDVADRCLSCANCTMVCPTCFCTTVEDKSELDGSAASREQRWDSCFTVDFSYIHGGSVRPGGKSRYRQWMTHKLATWHDQFDTSGCTGCGRCITWCPVGIDITEEAAALRATADNTDASHGD